RYFVEEQMVAAPLLVLVIVTMGLIGAGSMMQEFRVGLTTFLASSGAIWAAAAGFCYAGLCLCTTLIFLDRRENTFCIPMHCGSSMLAGFTATAFLSYFLGQSSFTATQTASAGLILIALGFLSPLHHFDRVIAKFKRAFTSQRAPISSSPGTPRLASVDAISYQIMILFVCSGNTCRSPMAAAIARAEIAARFPIPIGGAGHLQVQALSAGISARVGAPMTDDAKQALRELGIEPNGHRAQQLTPALASQSEKIFCMTESQRKAVATLAPAVAERTLCLDPGGDIEDPIGEGMEVYVRCAKRMQGLVKMRFDEFAISVPGFQ
ncbi:MAG TPA: hypothetical protein VFU37_24270, partial [Pyrinomonadaceae bacterium]|nr:hypothetical protein [Pyrinomonadaceae bacterium]